MTFIPVALATLDTTLPSGRGWSYEAKLDGYRIEAIVKTRPRTSVTLYSRNAHDWTSRFPAIADALATLPLTQAVFDGEVVVPVPAGQSAFQALQRALEAHAPARVQYVIFDLLAMDGADLRGYALRERQSLLRTLLQHRAAASPLRVVRRFSPRTGDPLRRACRAGLEGLVCKRLDARYVSGRSRSWIKVKCSRRQEFVVVGFTEPRGSRTGFGALLLAVYDANDRLRFAGKVGTGFDTAGITALHTKLRTLATPQYPLPEFPGRTVGAVHWVRPELVAEVAFTEWTEDGRLRHPVFQGLREDKSPHSVVREDPVPSRA